MTITQGSVPGTGKPDLHVGHFVFSLDTEFAWGGLWGQPHRERKVRDGAAEREVITRLLNMMDEFGIAATWAITGHLFFEKCEECANCPVLGLKGKDTRFDEIWGTQDSLWYGADVVETLLARGGIHEIGCHGYTHRTFDQLNAEEAKLEIQEWVRLANRQDIAHDTIIFPQGRIKHLDAFSDAGFSCYRGREVKHPALKLPVIGRILNKLNLQLAILAPQVFEPTVEPLGLVNIPGSLWLFRTNRTLESVLDSLNLHTLRLRPAAKSIARAAKEGKVIHLWAHPQEFRTDKDFLKLRFVFEAFAEHARTGRLRSITMSDLARRTLKLCGVGFDQTLSRPVSR